MDRVSEVPMTSEINSTNRNAIAANTMNTGSMPLNSWDLWMSTVRSTAEGRVLTFSMPVTLCPGLSQVAIGTSVAQLTGISKRFTGGGSLSGGG